MPAKAGIQYSPASAIEPKKRRLLDRPPSRTMTVERTVTPRANRSLFLRCAIADARFGAGTAPYSTVVVDPGLVLRGPRNDEGNRPARPIRPHRYFAISL